jgi:hypothetical protein
MEDMEYLRPNILIKRRLRTQIKKKDLEYIGPSRKDPDPYK